jgi:hypothetical protein
MTGYITVYIYQKEKVGSKDIPATGRGGLQSL